MTSSNDSGLTFFDLNKEVTLGPSFPDKRNCRRKEYEERKAKKTQYGTKS